MRLTWITLKKLRKYLSLNIKKNSLYFMGDFVDINTVVIGLLLIVAVPTLNY